MKFFVTISHKEAVTPILIVKAMCILFICLLLDGKAFIKKVSKKTGKEYKQYLPEIGKQINPKAYK